MKGAEMPTTFKGLFELALLEKATCGTEAAEEVVYEANALGLLPDADALYILNRLNGHI